MKALINTQVLLKELKRVSQVISPTTVIPILTSVKMVFEKGKLTLSATDLETTIVTSVACECPKGFTVIIEHKDISDICDKLSEPITIELKDKHVSIIGDKYKSKLPISGAEAEFPKIPTDDFLFSIDVDEQFFSAVYCADACRIREEIRTNMNTGCLDFRKDGLTVVGTNAVVMYKKDFNIRVNTPTRSQVRPKFVASVKEMKVAKLSVGEKFIKVEHDSVSVISRLQDSRYVDYNVILPLGDVDYNFKIDRKDFITDIKKVAATSNKKTNECVLAFGKGIVKISSQDIDFDKSGEFEISNHHSVDIDQIGFNAKQMLDILEMLDGEEVAMKFSSPSKSIYIGQPDDKSVFALVQPIMLLS